MIIRVIAVGRMRDRHWQEGAAEYIKRLQPYAGINIIEVPEARLPDRASRSDEELAMADEAGKILSKIKDDGPVVALDRQGTEWDSVQIAQWMKDRSMEGESAVTWLIGGAMGLSPEALKRADVVLSLSKLTFPHQMARLILLEQIYRSFRIIRGEPYHK